MIEINHDDLVEYISGMDWLSDEDKAKAIANPDLIDAIWAEIDNTTIMDKVYEVVTWVVEDML